MNARILLKTAAVLILTWSTPSLAISDFSLPWYDRSGTSQQTYNSYDYRNSVFVIEVFQLRCPLCNDNAPNIANLADEYRRSFMSTQVLSIGLDQDEQSYRQWIMRHSPSHPVLKDVGRQISQQLGVTQTPGTFVLDCRLNVRWQHSGVWSTTTISEIKATVSTLSQQPCQ